MLNWFKGLVAGRELEKLERMEGAVVEAKLWLQDFHDAQDALVYVQDRAAGIPSEPLDELRHRLRRRRDFGCGK